jgi:hypothetical protein
MRGDDAECRGWRGNAERETAYASHVSPSANSSVVSVGAGIAMSGHFGCVPEIVALFVEPTMAETPTKDLPMASMVALLAACSSATCALLCICRRFLSRSSSKPTSSPGSALNCK